MANIEVAGLVTKLSLDDSDLEKSMASLNRSMNLTKSQFAVASTGLASFGKGTDSLKIKSDSLTKQLQIQAAKVGKLQQEFNDEEKAKKRSADQTNKLEIRLNKAAAEYNKLHNEVTRINKDLATQSSAWTKAGLALDKTGDKMKSAGKKMDAAGQGLTRNVTAPLIAIGGLAAKASIDYESAFAGVRKTVNATEDELAGLSEGIRDMSKDIPASATSIAAVAEAAGQLGVKTDAILGFTRTMVDLGEATNMTSDQAATDLARLANITQMPQENFDRLGSTVVALGNKLAGTESEIVSMGLRLAGAGKQVGMSEAEILSFAGALSSVGIEAESGGSSMSRLMVDMQLATEKGGQSLKDFADVAGMSTKDFKKSFKNDASGAIIEFIKGLATTEKKGSSAIKVLDDMGITEIRMRDTLLRAAGAGDLFNTAIDVGTQAWKENTALTKEAEQRYGTNASKLAILKNKVVDVGITLGDALVPALTDALDAAKPLFNAIESGAKKFASMDKETQKTILKVAGFVAVAGPALSMGGKLAGSIGNIAKVTSGAAKLIGGFSTATSAAGAATATASGSVAALGAGTAALAGPIGIAVVAIAGLTIGGIALYKHLKKDAIPAVRDFGDEVSDSTQQAVEGFMTLYDEADASLKKLQWSGKTVSKETATAMTSNFDEMAEQVIGSLEKSRDEGTAAMREQFKNTTTISAEEQKELLGNIEDGYKERIATIEEKKARIKEIFETASKERRELSDEDVIEINQNYTEMKDSAVRTMSESEVEQRLILENMHRNASDYSALQAADVVKNSVEQKDGAIQAATDQYNELVKQYIIQRDDLGIITSEQADRLIDDAKRQRDGAVKAAKDMHKKVVKEAKKQAKEHIDQVDWETGEVLSKWDVFNNNMVDKIKDFVYPEGNAPKAPKKKSGRSASGFNLPEFDTGGVVPGPIGAKRLIIAHGGETVEPTHKPGYRTQQSSSVQRHEHSGTIRVEGVNNRGELVGIVETTVQDILRKEARG